MKHLVTGSRGFIGRHLMRALGDDAVGVDLPECDVTADPFCDPQQYYCDEGKLSRATKGIETVWHLAAINGSTQGFYERPWDVLNTQIRGTLNVIDACVANGVKTLVLFSSSEVYQSADVVPTPENVPLVVPDLKNPRFSYGGGKIAAELMAWWSPIPRVFVIRPHNIFGEGQGPGHVIRDLYDKISAAPTAARVDIPGTASHRRAFCHVSDFAQDCFAVLAHHEPDERVREVYHLGTEEEIMLADLADLVAEEIGRVDVELRFIGGPPGGTPRRCPSLAKMRSIGWLPGADFRVALKQTVAAYREAKG